ncbi:hypothetical protein B0T25DRAFT_534874 [Lasiosphaeria hispida]|uniref:Uncharacterized protein n=1 Tax=Lasiosphaeria hispida TaxID=260671 RepID=A0AAJ0HRJ1_9PEZI|nr:hypothetical protein B0T25DRAFT_534874 [Lasiosphaeria hispida]
MAWIARFSYRFLPGILVVQRAACHRATGFTACRSQIVCQGRLCRKATCVVRAGRHAPICHFVAEGGKGPLVLNAVVSLVPTDVCFTSRARVMLDVDGNLVRTQLQRSGHGYCQSCEEAMS